MDEFFFEENGESIPNAISIDMESKVINDLLLSENKFKYKKKFCFSREEGSGNNWAFGFFHHGKNSFEKILVKV